MPIGKTKLVTLLATGYLAGLLCSCRSLDLFRSPIPPTVAMNASAGNGGPLIVKLRLGDGEELPFMVDTGVFLTILDESLTNRLGPRLKTAVGGGRIGDPPEDVEVYAAPKLFLGGVQLTTSRWVLVSHAEKLTSRQGVMGILGMDCLKNYCVQLDFDDRQIRFLDPGRVPAGSLGTMFPLTMKKSELGGVLPYVDVGLAGLDRARFWVDTGFTGKGDLMLKPDLYQQMVKRHPPNRVGENLSFGQQHLNLNMANLPSAGFGGRTYTNLVILEMPSQLIEVPGWMSLQFLARHQVTLNFPRSVMYLKEREPLESVEGNR